MSVEISREKYQAMYGPTAGDRIRLADTDLIIQVERDYTCYGDEVKFGGGKTIRDGMGQAASHYQAEEILDLVITNCVILDYTGIYKADVGIRDGKIAGIGKAGNPDIMDGVTPGMVIGAGTEALAGEGLILTAGGLDTHIHLSLPPADRVCLKQRRDHHDRRRNGTGRRHQRHHLYPGCLEYGGHVKGSGGIPHESGISGEGKQLR